MQLGLAHALRHDSKKVQVGLNSGLHAGLFMLLVIPAALLLAMGYYFYMQHKQRQQQLQAQRVTQPLNNSQVVQRPTYS